MKIKILIFQLSISKCNIEKINIPHTIFTIKVEYGINQKALVLKL